MILFTKKDTEVCITMCNYTNHKMKALTLKTKKMNHIKFKTFLRILTLLYGLILPNYVFAQQITVNGHIQDTSGEPVIGATIRIANGNSGVVSDLDGNFILKANEGTILTITYVGYQSTSVKAVPKLTVILKEDNKTLNDVIVIGYGSVKKSDLTGSVVAIKAEDINRGAITSPQELLQGKVPGLFVEPGDGAPGSGSTIRIRGGASLNATNDPLIVIDGVPVSNDAAPGTPNALATINPNDIATFTVLKDASATAIYGSRASNGVIIITTKKGTSGKVKVSYSGTFSAQDPYKRIKVLNADDFRKTVLNEYTEGTTLGNAVRNILNEYPDQSTDWQNQIFQTGLGTDQNVSISGKTGFLPFRTSIGYNTERGTLKTSKYDRYTGSINLSPKFFQEHLSVDVNVKGTINTTRYADSGAISSAAFYDPTKPVYNTDNTFNGYWNWANGSGDPNTLAAVNPLSLLYERNNKGTTKRSLGNVQLDYKVHGLEDLHANLNLGYDVSKATGNNFVTPGSFSSAKDTDFKNLGQGNSWNNLRRNELLDFYLNYVKYLSIIKSNINVMAGYSWQHFYYNDYSVTKSNQVDESSFGEKDGWTYDSDEQRYIKDGQHASPYENYLVSFFGRLNYDFMNRYLLTATVRRDGSSRFAKAHRWGTFPSAALSWTISNEPFMRSTQNVLSNLKLRLSYGITGQQEFSNYYLYLTTYSLGTNPNGQYLNTYLLKPNGYNPDLKWEQTATYNIGFDYGFMNNRINGSIDYYQKHTKDLLNTVSTAAGTNFINQIIANVGSMKNEGIEFNVNAVPIQWKDFSWHVGYNITWNTSKVTKLTATYNPDYPGIDAGSASYGSNSTVLEKHQVGYAPYTFWLYQQVYDKKGRPIQNAFVDRNGDGQITEADRYMTNKSPMPKVYMGFSSEFNYKEWDLGFNLRANLGNYVYNAFAADNSTTDNFSNQGMISNFPKYIYKTGFTQTSRTEQRASDLYLENASFLKMDNITLGYSFHKLFSVNISGRISASIQNVFTITKYSGLDPETSSIDQNTVPRPRTYTVGLNLNF